MKKAIVTIAMLATAASTFAQGTVIFSNRIPGTVDAPVSYTVAPGSSATELATSQYWAQLFATADGTATGALEAVGDPLPFRDGAGAGYINTTGADTTRTLPNVPENGTGYFAVRAWDSSLGATWDAAVAAGLDGIGQSAVLEVQTGGGTTPPRALENLTGFTIAATVPEPGIVALGLLGAGLLLVRRKK